LADVRSLRQPHRASSLPDDGGKQPWRFVRADEDPFAFAGLWEFARIAGEDILSTTIIVGEPNPLVGGVHDRLPVMLTPAYYDRWLDPEKTVEQLRAMMRPYDPDLMKAYEVSRVVNRVKNDTPDCVQPLEGAR